MPKRYAGAIRRAAAERMLADVQAKELRISEESSTSGIAGH
jgi:hypothetical protein